MSLSVPTESLDAQLVSLFEKPSRPVEISPLGRGHGSSSGLKHQVNTDVINDKADDASASPSIASSPPSESLDISAAAADDHGLAASGSETMPGASSRRRKRKRGEEEIEDAYMRKLVKADAREARSRELHRGVENVKTNGDHPGRTSAAHDQERSSSSSRSAVSMEEEEEEEEEEGEEAVSSPPPRHEALDKEDERDDIHVEKASRTVFLANVSTEAIASKSAKKTLLQHLSSFFPALGAANKDEVHKIESIRFRSTAFSMPSIPKKAAYARKELMPETTKGTNAYVVYSTALAAREAVKRLNGTVVLDRHLRVDSVAHPAPVDHRRCVFVGNLGFVDEETRPEDDDDDGEKPAKKRKKSKADVEEGLWRQFSKAGTVESVRVVRDAATRVGKGFAYVQFTDANAVEAALLYNDKRFPPLLPRKLRVSRAKKVKKTGSGPAPSRSGRARDAPGSSSVYVSKPSSAMQSLQGRAQKLLGRGGAAKLRQAGLGENGPARPQQPVAAAAAASTTIFEGHRANQDERPTLKQRPRRGPSQKGKKTPRIRQRTTAWKQGAVGKGAKR